MQRDQAQRTSIHKMILSGREREPIALAFFKEVPIIMLDEPAGSVDTKTPGVIMGAMERLMQGCTAWIIAHRLGMLPSCDVQLEVEDTRRVNLEQQRILVADVNGTKSLQSSKEDR